MSKAIVVAKCVCCGDKREIAAGEIPRGEQPMCGKCGCPMVAESAKVRR